MKFDKKMWKHLTTASLIIWLVLLTGANLFMKGWPISVDDAIMIISLSVICAPLHALYATIMPWGDPKKNDEDTS